MKSLGLFATLLLACAEPAFAAPRAARQLTLNGDWRFTTDSQDQGEALRWHDAVPETGWDRVNVPHCWSVDPRFPYAGAAWYRRGFPTPSGWDGMRVRLRFGAVFYKARVWVNGKLAGAHEGGYTPFELDVTELLQPAGQANLLVVLVDNRWDYTTLPGARPGTTPQTQVYPWWDFGGIIRDVTLQAVPPLSIDTLKVEAEPDLASGTARIRIAVRLRNSGADASTVNVSAEPHRDGKPLDAAYRRQQALEVPAHGSATARLELQLIAPDVSLWHPDSPRLYTLKATAGDDELETSFGIRKLEARGSQLLLNGEPIRMAGANRPVDHPAFGSMEPAEVVERDLRLMKEAGLEMMRLIHYAPDPRVVEWADRHGMLLILEAGNWQLVPEQMDSPLMRARWQSQMREMVERDWNHPSVVAWSVGNEFLSDTPSGIAWVRDGREFVRSLDPTRFITFASDHAASPSNRRPTDEASHLVDLVMVNVYSSGAGLARALDHVHELYPDKPLLISEFGARADAVDVMGQPIEGDPAVIRDRYFQSSLAVIRARPWVSGASVWTFNDYRSRFPSTSPSGYRLWGLVDEQRRPRQIYRTLQREFTPAVIAKLEGSLVTIAGRGDFPSYTLRGYSLRFSLLDGAGKTLQQSTLPVPTVQPGKTVAVRLPKPAGAASCRLQLIRPTGIPVGGEQPYSLQ
jgi:beta-glucuronidase